MSFSALCDAARSGDINAVTDLLAKGADPNLYRDNDGTALMWAAQNEHTLIVQKLLKQGAKPDIQNNKGTTALIIAAAQGHAEIVQNLLDYGATTDIENDPKTTALIYAAQGGHTEIVQKLLNHRANPNRESNEANTPLSLAAMKRHTATVNELLKHGANPLFKNKNGKRADEVIGTKKNIANILAENQQALISAFKDQDIKKFNLVMQTMPALIGAPLPPSFLKKAHWTMPLHFAAENGCPKFFVDIINQLKISYQIGGENPDEEGFRKLLNLIDSEEKTVSKFASSKGAKALADYIDALVANPNDTAAAETRFLSSPLPPPPPSITQKFSTFVTKKINPRPEIDAAIENCDVTYFRNQRQDEIHLLAESGWLSNHNALHTLILHWKTIKSHDDFERLKNIIIENLRKLPPSKSDAPSWFKIAFETSWYDYTPLEFAIASDNLEAVEWLLSFPGLEFNWINSRNYESLTPFHQAVIKGNSGIVKAILEKFPEKNQALLEATCLKTVTDVIDEATSVTRPGDFYGFTALRFAVHHKNEHVIEILLKHGADPSHNLKNIRLDGRRLPDIIRIDQMANSSNLKQKEQDLIDAIAAAENSPGDNFEKIFEIFDNAPAFLTIPLLSDKGMTALHHAAINPALFLQILELIDSKKPAKAQPVLEVAGLSEEASLSQKQLEALNKKDANNNSSPLQLALQHLDTTKHFAFVNSLKLNREQKIAILNYSIKSGHSLVFKCLSPTCTLTAEERQSLLNLAIQNDRYDIAKSLLDSDVSAAVLEFPISVLSALPSTKVQTKYELQTKYFELFLQHGALLSVNLRSLDEEAFIETLYQKASKNKTLEQVKAMRMAFSTNKDDQEKQKIQNDELRNPLQKSSQETNARGLYWATDSSEGLMSSLTASNSQILVAAPSDKEELKSRELNKTEPRTSHSLESAILIPDPDRKDLFSDSSSELSVPQISRGHSSSVSQKTFAKENTKSFFDDSDFDSELIPSPATDTKESAVLQTAIPSTVPVTLLSQPDPAATSIPIFTEVSTPASTPTPLQTNNKDLAHKKEEIKISSAPLPATLPTNSAENIPVEEPALPETPALPNTMQAQPPAVFEIPSTIPIAKNSALPTTPIPTTPALVPAPTPTLPPKAEPTFTQPENRIDSEVNPDQDKLKHLAHEKPKQTQLDSKTDSQSILPLHENLKNEIESSPAQSTSLLFNSSLTTSDSENDIDKVKKPEEQAAKNSQPNNKTKTKNEEPKENSSDDKPNQISSNEQFLNDPYDSYQPTDLFSDTSTFWDKLVHAIKSTWASILNLPSLLFDKKSDAHIPEYRKPRKINEPSEKLEKVFVPSFNKVNSHLAESISEVAHINNEPARQDRFFDHLFSSPKKRSNHLGPLSDEDKRMIEEGWKNSLKKQIEYPHPKMDFQRSYEEPSFLDKILRR
jgi:ankyrin repeat protein